MTEKDETIPAFTHEVLRKLADSPWLAGECRRREDNDGTYREARKISAALRDAADSIEDYREVLIREIVMARADIDMARADSDEP